MLELFRKSSGWKLPGDEDRTSVVGKTGSGKTTAGLFLLSQQKMNKPWIVLDFKGDEKIMGLPLRDIKSTLPPPVEPGLYRLHSDPFDDPAIVNGFLRKVWQNGKTGLFFDEAYMIPDRHGRTTQSTLRALYTTGRSRKIPIIALTQRPVDVIKYNFTEAEYHLVFRLPDKDDRDIARHRIPNEKFDAIFGKHGTDLQEFHSLWYDVSRDKTFVLSPFPSPEEIMGRLTEMAKINLWV